MGFYFPPKKIYLIHHFLIVRCREKGHPAGKTTHEMFASVIPG